MANALPRVTYANIGVDLTAVHDHLDAEIPRFKARMAGRHWPNVIAGAPDDEGERYDVATPIDRAEAGVLYANRASGATTGAWPGIQSFCGWKGSGLTNKGGLGPHYLPQFMREQSRTLMRQSPSA